MGGLAGLAALTNLLGGGAVGANKGYDEVREEQLKRDTLAEATRHNQALEGPLNTKLGDFYGTLGLPVPQGVDPNTQIPTALGGHAISAINAQTATANEAARRGRVAGALDEIAKSEQVPYRPLSDIEKQQKLVGAGVHGDELTAFENVLHPKPVNVPMGSKAVNPNTKEVIAEGNPYMPRGQDYVSIHNALVDAGWDPNAQGFAQEVKRQMDMNKVYPVGPDQKLFGRDQINPGIKPPPGGPQTGRLPDFTKPPAQQGGAQPMSFEQYYGERRVAGIPTDQILGEWQQLNSGKPTTIAQGGGSAAPGEPKPRLERQTTEPATETKQVAQTKQYLDDVSKLAERLKAYHAGQNATGEATGNGGRALMAGKQFLLKYDPTGLARSNTYTSLTEEQTAIDSEVQRLLREYENAKGGMRAVSGQQIQAALAAVHGGEGLSNRNSWINLANLANAELRHMNTLGATNVAAGRRDISSMPGRQEIPIPGAGGGSPFEQWKAKRR